MVPCPGANGSALAFAHGSLVGVDNRFRRAVLPDGGGLNPDHAMAKAANLIKLMADEDYCATGAGDVAHFAQAFFLEVDVADSKDFIDEEDFRLEMGGDGEGQADVHAGGVVLDGSVNEFFKLGEGDDFVEFAVDFALAHAEDSAGEEGVFAAGELAVEAGADFEEATNASMNLRPSGGRFCNAREDFQEGSLAGAITADETEDFAFADLEGLNGNALWRGMPSTA